MKEAIDLNCDMGELPEAVAGGAQESLMPFVTSVNVACGAHAGDERTMRETVEQALRWRLAVGAHPGYPDRTNFGRLALEMPVEAIEETVYGQVRALARIAGSCGAAVVHVKPHGALYNEAARKADVARAVAAGTARWSRDVTLIGLAGSPMLDVFREAGFRAAAEAFADRRYEPDGRLRARLLDAALVEDPSEAARQALGIALRGTVTAWDGTEVRLDAQTLCIHGDSPGALEIAEAVARALREASIRLACPWA